MADDNDIPVTRADRLRSLYETDARKPLAPGARERIKTLSNLIAREAPDQPVRTPFEELMGKKE